MKEIKIIISDKNYQRIDNLITWINTRDLLLNNNKEDDYRSVESFIKGAGIFMIEQIENINPTVPTPLRSETKFRNRFKEIAKERGIRQTDICNALGIEKSYLSTIFNNKNQPNAELFFKIWVILRCPPIYNTFYFED